MIQISAIALRTKATQVAQYKEKTKHSMKKVATTVFNLLEKHHKHCIKYVFSGTAPGRNPTRNFSLNPQRLCLQAAPVHTALLSASALEEGDQQGIEQFVQCTLTPRPPRPAPLPVVAMAVAAGGVATFVPAFAVAVALVPAFAVVVALVPAATEVAIVPAAAVEAPVAAVVETPATPVAAAVPLPPAAVNLNEVTNKPPVRIFVDNDSYSRIHSRPAIHAVRRRRSRADGSARRSWSTDDKCPLVARRRRRLREHHLLLQCSCPGKMRLMIRPGALTLYTAGCVTLKKANCFGFVGVVWVKLCMASTTTCECPMMVPVASSC